MVLTCDEIRNVVQDVLLRAGANARDAEIVTDVLLEAELRGRRTHGLIRLKSIAQAFRKSPTAEIMVVKEDRCYAHLDAQGTVGYAAAYHSMAYAIRKARESGLAVVGVRNATHCGMAGYFVAMASKEDLIGLMMCDCRPRIVPHGGLEPVLGTNPIAVAIPSDRGPVILDMSTASITVGDLLVAIRSGAALPEGLAYDRDGQPTTDPQEALSGGVAAFGGHKGYGLALVTQILSSCLVGAEPIPVGGTNYGYFCVVIDPTIFVPLDRFKADVARLVAALKGAKSAPEVEEILVPGERAMRERETRLRDGVEVADELLEEIQTLQRPG